MAEQISGNFGRLAYFDPNTSIFKNQMGTNSDSITFPYEDYNMAVELIIREFNRYSCGFSNVSNEFKDYRYSTDNGSISFLGGTKVKDDNILEHMDNWKYLTTNYTDVSMTSPSANTQECLGIESIEISYQSWFHPQVTIKFVDVRGATVMMQAENAYYNPDTLGSNSNIYRTFFSFPYPMFILKVKGFYGKGVTYRLAISKTKIDLDANSGNFVITVDFIGHMYGIFADFPMNYLAIAPYTSEGSLYWKEKVEDGTFCFRGPGGLIQAPMLTFPQLKDTIAKAMQSFDCVQLESEGGVKTENLNAQAESLTNLMNQYAKVFGNDITFEVSSDKEHIFRLGSSKFSEFKEEAEKFYKMLKEYKASFHPTDDVYYDEFGGDITRDEIIKKLAYRYIQFTECKDNGIGYAPNKSRYNQVVSEQSLNEANGGIYNTELVEEAKHSYEDFDEFVKNNQEVLDKIESRRNGLTNFSLYIISKPTGKTFEEIVYRDMPKEKESLIQQKDKNEEEYKNLKNQYIEKALGFTPSIKNMYELAFAHFDTFLEVFYKRMSIIKSQLDSGSIVRKKDYYNVIDENTDTEKRIHRADIENTISRADYLPPFTAFYKDNRDPSKTNSNGEIQKKILMWPGELIHSENLEELEFIKDLINASKMYYEENTAVDANIASMSGKTFRQNIPASDVTKFIPLTTYDLANNGKFENPYLDVKRAIKSNSEDMIGRFFLIFSLRAFYYLSTLQKGYSGKRNWEEDYTFGRLEAVNFFKAVGEINSPKFFEFLKKYADDKGEGKEEKEFLEYITTEKIEKGITDVWLDKNSLTAGRHLFKKTNNNTKLQYDYYKPVENGTGLQYFPLGVFDPATLKRDLATGDELLDNEKYISANKIYSYSGDNETFEIGKPLKGGTFFIYEDRDYLLNVQNNIKSAIEEAKQALKEREGDKTYGNKGLTDFGEIRTCDYDRYSNNVNTTNSEHFYDKYIIRDINDKYSRSTSKTLTYSGTAEQFNEFYIKFPVEYNDSIHESIFDKPIYQIQDNIIAKACLFLFGVPLLGDGNTASIDELSYNGVTAKSILLREGALIWYEKQRELDKDLKFEGVIGDKTYHFARPKKGEWLARNRGNTDADNCETLCAEESTNYYGDGYFKYRLPYNRTPSREIYLEEYFLDWAEHDFKAMEPYLSDSRYYIDEKFSEGLNYSAASNTEIQIMLRKFYFQLCTTFDYYHGTAPMELNENGVPSITYNVLECDEQDMRDAFRGFMDQLEKIYKDAVDDLKNNGDSFNEQLMKARIDDPFQNDDIKLSTYMTVKNLYDKWLCGSFKGENTYRFRHGNGGYELDNFIYCDNFFHDIGDVLCVNMTKLSDWLSQITPTSENLGNEGEMQVKSKSIYDYLTSVAEMAGGYLLAIPQKMMYNDIESIKEAFTPIPSCGNWDEDTSTYMFLYSYKPSQHLGGLENSNVDMNGWSQEGDGFDLTNEDIVGTMFNDAGTVVPAFGVTFAKQNQAYFKNISLTSTSPAITEVGIANTMSIASKSGEEIRKTTLFGQDIYKIYGNYAYECSVEMMGCMQIFPPMYFQLNNVPMWKGAYMIQKVTHSIKPGDITTKITGVRQNKYAVPLTDANMIGFIGKIGSEVGADNETYTQLGELNSIEITDTIGDNTTVLNLANESDFKPENVSENNPLICLTPAHGPKTQKKNEWSWSSQLIDEKIIPMLKAKKIIDANGNELSLNIHRCNVDGKNSNKVGYNLKETEELIKKYGSKKVISIVPHWNGGGGRYYVIFDGKVLGDRKDIHSAWTNPRSPKYREDSVILAKFMAAEVNNFLDKKDLYTKAPDGMFKNLKTDMHLLFTESYNPDKTDPAVKMNCACILTENWFADYGTGYDRTNYNQLINGHYTNGRAWLESDEGLTAIGEMHVKAIINYINSLNKPS